MSKLNLLVHINSYRDTKDTNNPSLNHVKWNVDIQGIDVLEPRSNEVELAAGQSYYLFSGSVSISADNTTTWNIALKSGSNNTYRISHAGGTAPSFRTARTEGHDATTEVTVTKNAKLLTFTATGGTLWDLSAAGVQVGDEVRIGDAFNQVNQGYYKILAFSATSFTIENESGAAEGPITLGVTFADQVNIYSSDGVQRGDKVDIVANFSLVSFGTYEITDVSHDYIEIFSNDALPEESGVSNNPDALLIYRNAKTFVYIESDKKLDIKIDGSLTNTIDPISVGTSKKPGIFMSTGSIKSLEVENKSQETATVFYISAE